MALESATYISDLVPSNPVSSDGLAETDNHVRMIKQVLQATFPNGSEPLANFFIPSGGIIDWSGSIASIPPGWALCDGNNGTPDLRDRFIVAAGGAYSVGATGGSDAVSLTTPNMPAHNHGGGGTFTTTNNGNHSHTGSTTSNGNHRHRLDMVGDYQGGTAAPSDGGGTPGESVGYTEYAGDHSHNLNINSSGAHTHSVQVDIATEGSGTAHENRPPYYALAKIMKL